MTTRSCGAGARELPPKSAPLKVALRSTTTRLPTKTRLAAVLVTLLGSGAGSPHAWAGDVAGRAAATDATVEATVVNRRSEWAGGVIVTRTTVRVDRVVRGTMPPLSAPVEVMELGGRVGDISQIAAGQPAMPSGPGVTIQVAAIGSHWHLTGVLDRVVENAAAPDGSGYVRTTTKDSEPPCEGDSKEVSWPTADVHYVLDDACSPDVDRDSCEASVRASFQTWQDVACSSLNLSYDGRKVDVPLGYQRNGPNLNAVKWIEADWPGPPDAAAVTLVSIGCSAGRILDADILVNGALATFTTAPVPGEGRLDVQNTITHEVGHLAGFAHVPDPESTMYFTGVPGETSKRSLTVDDAQGLCMVYPIGHDPDGNGCGCAAGGRQSDPMCRALVLAAVLVAIGRARRRRGTLRG